MIAQIFLANNCIEGYMAIIGPVINPRISSKVKPTFKPTNTFYKNFKIKQDFDPDSVIMTTSRTTN